MARAWSMIAELSIGSLFGVRVSPSQMARIDAAKIHLAAGQ
jgi:hypothetical protein